MRKPCASSIKQGKERHPPPWGSVIKVASARKRETRNASTESGEEKEQESSFPFRGARRFRNRRPRGEGGKLGWGRWGGREAGG